jgi:hypothetical protein
VETLTIRFSRVIPVTALLILFAVCAFSQGELPINPDTLRVDTLSVWPDTAAAFADTAAPQQVSFREGWLLPVGVILVTCSGILMLFSLRSR